MAASTGLATGRTCRAVQCGQRRLHNCHGAIAALVHPRTGLVETGLSPQKTLVPQAGNRMFKLTSREIAEIFASELAGMAMTGAPLIGTAAAFTTRALMDLVENTAELRFPQQVDEASDEFLNQHPLPLQALYHNERLLRGRLLYVEQANFIDLLVGSGEVQIEIANAPGVFALAPFDDPGTERLRDAGFSRLREVGKYRHDSDVVRVSQIVATDRGARLVVQKARFSDQARSNLILDFNDSNRAPSLRAALLRESPGLLPRLDDRRLANSLGVTILVFYRDDSGALVPFLVPRTKKTAVLNRGLWSDSASGAAEWPRDEQSTPKTFEGYILDDLYKELEDEIGLQRGDISTVLPLAIGREIMRAGKPQIFFIGFTPLRRPDLLRRMNAARLLARKNPIEPPEVHRMPTFRKPPRPGDPSQLHNDYEVKLLDPQCAASLYYSLTFLQKLGPRLGNLA